MSTRTPPQSKPASTIPETTLSAARSGSLSDLQAIYSALPQCYSLEIFHIFLYQLQKKWSSAEDELVSPNFDPNNPPKVLADRVDSVILSLAFFGRLPECLEAHPELSYKTVLEATTALPTLFLWLSAYLRAPPPEGDTRTPAEIQRHPFTGQQDFEIGHIEGIQHICATASDVLRAMLFLDPFTKKKLVQLELAIQIAVVLWITTMQGEPIMQTASRPPEKLSGMGGGGGKTRELDAVVEQGRADRLLEVMRTLVAANPKGVVSVLTSGIVCSLDTFVGQTLSRVRSTTAFHRIMTRAPPGKSLPNETYELVNIEHLVEMTQVLIAETPTREAFFKHACIAAFVDLIMATREHLVKDGLMDVPPYQHKDMITHWSCHIFEWSVYQSGSLLSNLSSIVKAGMLQVVVDSFAVQDTKSPVSALSTTPEGRVQLLSDIRTKHAPGSPRIHAKDSIDDAKYMLSVLISYASYPRFLPALRRQVSAIPESALVDLHEYDERRIMFRALEQEVSEGSEYLKRRNRVVICDNLEHDSTPHPLVPCSKRELQKPQTCSKCHSVVYCSRECQRRDWTERHRHECSNAHREYTDMKHSDEWYSHPTRAFHLSLLLDAFELCYRSQKPKTDLPNDPRAFNDFKAPPTADSIGVRCFDLTAKREGCVFRPFNVWAVAHGGLNMPPWKRKRFGDMTNLLKASHFASVLRANAGGQSEAAGGDIPKIQGMVYEPERYFCDAQFLFGDRILHLFGLLRKEDEPRRFGDASYEYAVEGSLFFFETLKSRNRHEKVQKSLVWLCEFFSKIFKSVSVGTWVALVPLVITAKMLDVI